MNRNSWLKSLRVGDKVFIFNRFGKRSVHGITKITPAGKIYIEDIKFNSHGNEITNRTFNRSFLGEYSEEQAKVIQDETRKLNITSRLHRADWKLVSIEKLSAIAAILDSK